MAWCPGCRRTFRTQHGLGLHFWQNKRRGVDCSPMEEPMLKLWLYRVIETDEDGDPIDHGVVKASTKKLAIRLVTKHIKGIADATDAAGFNVRLYQMRDRPDAGVLDDVGFMDFFITGHVTPENPPKYDAAGAASNRALLGAD